MGGSETGDITRLLRAHGEGDREAFDRLVPLVYDRLTAIARGRVRRSAADRAGLDTVGLVHETWMQMVEEQGVSWRDRGHFLAVCARAMRRIVVDHARRRGAGKRGGGSPPATLETAVLGIEDQAELALSVDQALARLASVDERLARVVECRFYAGMTEEETAEAMATSLRTAQRLWMRARAWLQKSLG